MVKKINDECFKLSNLPKEGLDKIRTGEVDLTNTAVKNHIFCYTKKVGFINDAGILNDDLIKTRTALQFNDKDKVEKGAKICNVPKTADEEPNYFSAKVVACYFKNFPGIEIL